MLMLTTTNVEMFSGQERALLAGLAAHQLRHPLSKLHVKLSASSSSSNESQPEHDYQHGSSGGLVRSKSLSGLSCPATWSRTVEEVLLHKVRQKKNDKSKSYDEMFSVLSQHTCFALQGVFFFVPQNHSAENFFFILGGHWTWLQHPRLPGSNHISNLRKNCECCPVSIFMVRSL